MIWIPLNADCYYRNRELLIEYTEKSIVYIIHDSNGTAERYVWLAAKAEEDLSFVKLMLV